MTFNPPTLFIAHRAICRWHEIHSSTYSTVWCVGLLPLRAALRLNYKQICKTSLLKRWCAWRTGSGQASLWSAPCFPNTRCLCNAPRVYFPCKHHLEMGDISAVKCLEISQYFKRSCFPRCPLTACGEVSPTTANRSCKSYSHNTGCDELLLSRCPAAHAAKCQWCTCSPEQVLGALAPWTAGAQRSEWYCGLHCSQGPRDRGAKRKTTTCLYLSCKKGRQDRAVDPAGYSLWLLTKSWQLLWFVSQQT